MPDQHRTTTDGTSDAIGFDGQVVLVTGAARGIGRAHALLLARLGAALVINDVDEDALREVEKQLRDLGAPVEIVVGDVLDTATQLVERALHRWDHLDAVVNNAGTVMTKPFADTELNALLRVHVLGTTAVTRAALDGLRASQCGAASPVRSAARGGFAVHLGDLCGSLDGVRIAVDDDTSVTEQFSDLVELTGVDQFGVPADQVLDGKPVLEHHIPFGSYDSSDDGSPSSTIQRHMRRSTSIPSPRQDGSGTLSTRSGSGNSPPGRSASPIAPSSDQAFDDVHTKPSNDCATRPARASSSPCPTIGPSWRSTSPRVANSCALRPPSASRSHSTAQVASPSSLT